MRSVWILFQGPIRPAGWALRICSRPHPLVLRWIVCLALLAGIQLIGLGSVRAQHEEGYHPAPPDTAVHEHHDAHAAPGGWEGSAEGTAYSEFNHHVAGFFVLLIGLSELTLALRSPRWPWLGWAPLLLPATLTATGIFLLIWSDHEAWPIGSMGFAESFFGQDHEIAQHKTYGMLALAVGMVEVLRFFEVVQNRLWTVPLPLFAIIGGFMLFGHSHGAHPAAYKIFIHHTIMGSLAVTAGASKVVAGWTADLATGRPSRWELLWACLILLIGLQLLIYSE